ncbi:MAG: PilW family protein [Proteobacteria bacterium]|nr:PilW family protein [Pseudomonadota bacterium]
MKITNQKGFTLVELIIALFLSAIVLAGMSTFFRSQQDTYIAQEEVAEMQQEIRAGLEIISRELRNTGHDMTPNKTAGAGFVVASPFQIQFTMDLIGTPVTNDPDGDILDANENMAFRLVTDADNNGVTDVGAANLSLGRDNGVGGLQDLISNVNAIGFAYAYDNNADGVLENKVVGAANQVIWAVPNGAGAWIDIDTNADGVIDATDAAPAPVGVATAAQLGQIRAVRIWILARASRTDPKYTDGNIYKVGANVINFPANTINGVLSVPPLEVNFRRRLLTANVRCRNMGIQIP